MLRLVHLSRILPNGENPTDAKTLGALLVVKPNFISRDYSIACEEYQ